METITDYTRDLYDAFSSYNIEGNLRDRSCDCCVTDYEIKTLLSKQLKELNEGEIGHFMSSAVTTYGNVEDYKHFLPRILELMLNNDSLVDDFLTFEKLNYCKWLDWNSKEVNAIKQYFKMLLKHTIDSQFESINDYILLNLEYNDIVSIKDIFFNSNSEKLLLKIVDDLFYEYQYSIDERLLAIYSDDRLLKQLESLFFKTKNGNDADRISVAYTILEKNGNYKV